MKPARTIIRLGTRLPLFLLPLCLLAWGSAALAQTQQPAPLAPVIQATELERLPREGGHYTQGLFFYGGFLYESTGQYDSGAVYRLDAGTGKTLGKAAFPKFFLEGSTALNGVLHVLTWRDGMRLELDPLTLRELGRKPLHGQGWGLCNDGSTVWKSDGSPMLTQYAVTAGNTAWQPLRRLTVTDGGSPVADLNELEWIQGRIWANVYGSPRIAVLDPSRARLEDGREVCPVLFWLDCSALLPPEAQNPEFVFNGIAWDETRGVLLVTGKMWPFFSRLALPGN